MYRLITTPGFERQARKFAAAQPQLKKRLAAVLRQLEADPAHHSLHLHPLHGALQGIHAVRVNFSFRLTLLLKIAAKEIVLLDIGNHDAVYR